MCFIKKTLDLLHNRYSNIMTQTWNLLQTGQKEGYKIAYTNARIIDPETKLDIKGSLLTEGDKIVDFGESLFSTSGVDETIDCKGLVLMPGLIDIHVHFREPGQEHKETIYTGSKSAAAGGVTTVVCQPNTIPAIDSVVLAKYLKYRALETSHVNVEFYVELNVNHFLHLSNHLVNIHTAQIRYHARHSPF
ncbi:dihydroorotase [Wolbachia endosymbiont of Drosophila ananassae]|nr:dihydroorotase [Wolbachia endosymbiont of Drosophila ananassae]